MTTCPAGPSRDQIILNVYDNSDTVRGVQSYSRTRNPGLTAGFSISTDTQGNVNPIGLPARPVYRRPGSQPGETVILYTPNVELTNVSHKIIVSLVASAHVLGYQYINADRNVEIT